MNKNIKRMFFVTTLLILLVSITALSAADTSNHTSTTIQQDMVKEVNVEKVSDNIITDTSTKNIKKEEQTTDLYVSDTSGSDDNSGTNTSPYKTIQKALDTTNADSTFNIHIAEGTYKGLGNTNLTVNGEYTINFIGEGINKTIFDGEASYLYNDAGGYYWGSSKIWESYLGCKGNWIMNITSGSGKITIKNMTITKTMNTGGASISAYKTSAINNYGNTYIDTVYFKDNMGGVGAATRNRENASIHINNSIFEGNRKADSMGNYGSALYNNGTAIMENSLVFNNYARWGTITSDRNLTLINCTIRDNIGYDGGSTYKYGAGVAIDTTLSAGEHIEPLGEMNTIIKDSTFINNQMTDIYVGNTTLIVDNCTFDHSPGIYIAKGEDNRTIQSITNSNFINMTASTIATSLSVSSGETKIINQIGLYQLNIINNTFLPDKDVIGDKIALRLTSGNYISNNNITGFVSIKDDNKVYNNTINGRIGGSRGNEVVGNWIHDTVVYGDKAIGLGRNNNLVENNTPELGAEYYITEENYSEYFDVNDMIITDAIEDGSIVYLGNLKNHDITVKDKNIEIVSLEDSILENVTFTITDSSKVVMRNLQINTDNQKDYVIILNSTDNSISECTINTTTIKTPIIINDKYNSFTNNKLNINCTSEESDEIIAIDIKDDNSNIQRNNLNIKSNSKITGMKAFNTEKTWINNNNIILDSTGDMTVINADNTNKSTFIETKIITNTTGNIEVIKANNCNDITVNLICDINTTGNVTGVIIQAVEKAENIKVTSMTGSIQADNVTALSLKNTDNNTISYVSNPLYITANHTLAIYFNNTNNTTIQYNFNIQTKDTDSTVLKIENSNYNIISPKVTTNIDQQVKLHNSHNNTISPVNNVISSNDTPVLLYNSNNNIVTNLNITTIESDDCIILENSNNNQIINNNLNSKELIGDNTIKEITSSNNTIEHNSGYALITMDNYDDYFDYEGVFITMQTGTIEFGSDFYDKSFTFNGNYNITNPNKYTLYNATMTLNGEQAMISNIIINTTNISNVLYANSTKFKVINATIYHENDDITRTMIITNNVNAELTGLNITTLGPEIETNDDIPSTIAIHDNSNFTRVIMNDENKIVLKPINSSITVMSTRQEGGFIAGYYSDEKGQLTYTSHQLALPTMTLKGKNVTAFYLDKKIINQTSITINKFNHLIDAEDANLLYLKNSENNIITGLNITTDLRYPIILENVTNSTITVNYLNSSDTYYGDQCVLEINSTNNNIFNNTPIIRQYIITDENYNDYFDEEGNFKITLPTNNHLYNTVKIGSDIYNKNFIFEQAITFTNNGNYTIFNGTITMKKGVIINISINTSDDRENVLILGNVSVNNSNIYHYSTKTIKTIIPIGTSIFTLNNNTLTIIGPEIKTEDNIPSTIGILSQSKLVLNNTNKINISYSISDNEGISCGVYSNSTKSGETVYIVNNEWIINTNNMKLIIGHIFAFRSNNISINSNNNITVFEQKDYALKTIINNNTFNISSENNIILFEPIYEAKLSRPTEFSNNTLCLSSNNSIVLIKSSPNKKVSTIGILNNTITLTSKNIILLNITNSSNGYGISNNALNITSTNSTLLLSMNNATGNINNNTIIINTEQIRGLTEMNNSKATINNNYIQTPTASGDNAIETTEGLTVFNNTPTDRGFKTQINEVTLPDTIYAYAENTITVNVTDLFDKEVTGTLTLTDGKSITTSDTQKITYTPKTTGENTLTVTYSDPTGKYESTNTTITLNVQLPTLTVDPVTATIGETINITARITAGNETITNINKGKVTFKVNGKTLKDTNGKVIYAKVVNGVATIENYVVPDDWAKEGTTIQAVYSGSAYCEKLSSEKTNITINKEAPTLTTSDITATAGETITLTATITDNNKIINTGKIVFKINGKTVKDANGKVIYAKVVNNQVSIDYTLPADMKAKNYTITATFISSDYDNLTDTKTLTITT